MEANGGTAMVPRARAAGKPAQAGGRIESLDIFRGLAIIAVVAIHVTGHVLPGLRVGGAVWYTAALGNRLLQFAVPAFLTLSAFLNIRTLLRGESLAVFARKRLLRALWPYVLWSLLYALFRTRAHPHERTLANVWNWLLTGNAYYHLYFLLLVLQLYVVLPFIAPLFRKRPSFARTAAGALLLQAAVYLANRRWHFFPEPGSILLWYIPSVTLGCWLATRSDRLAATLRRGTPLALLAAAGALLVYVPLSLALIAERPLSTARYQYSLWVYSAGAIFLLLALSQALRGTGWRRVLDPIGARSLEIYLVHPLVIWALDAWVPGFTGLRVRLALGIYMVACVVVPMVFAALAQRLRLGRWLWGVADNPSAPKGAR